MLNFLRPRKPRRRSRSTARRDQGFRIDSEPAAAKASPEFPELRRLVAGWAEAWELPGLERRIDITFSPRFRTSLGRCLPATGEVRLASFLLTGPPSLLHEALCHEAAHAAVFELHGSGRRPHGTEWKALMRAVDLEPRARIPADLLPELPPHRVPRGPQWKYCCPVCHASRTAHRRVPGWRCAACRRSGLAGDLLVTRIDVEDLVELFEVPSVSSSMGSSSKRPESDPG